jgi:hypothetical protein
MSGRKYDVISQNGDVVLRFFFRKKPVIEMQLCYRTQSSTFSECYPTLVKAIPSDVQTFPSAPSSLSLLVHTLPLICATKIHTHTKLLYCSQLNKSPWTAANTQSGWVHPAARCAVTICYVTAHMTQTTIAMIMNSRTSLVAEVNLPPAQKMIGQGHYRPIVIMFISQRRDAPRVLRESDPQHG